MASKSNKTDSTITSVESSTKQLEAIITVLEDDNTSLEKSLETFEQGIKLTRSIQKNLEEAEQKVQLLMQNDQDPVYKDFEVPE